MWKQKPKCSSRKNKLIQGIIFTWQKTTTRQWAWMKLIHTKVWMNVKSIIVVVQSLTPVWLFETPWTAAHQTSMSFTVSRSLLKLMSIKSAMPSNHLILHCPLLLLPSIFPSLPAYLILKSIVLKERNKTEDTIWVYLKYKSRENYSSMKNLYCGYSQRRV